MILTCPACGTQYVVKDGAVPPGGRKVRCASCRHSWHQDPVEPVTLELSDEVPEDVPAETQGLPSAGYIDPDEAESRGFGEGEAASAYETDATAEPVAPPVEGLVDPPLYASAARDTDEAYASDAPAEQEPAYEPAEPEQAYSPPAEEEWQPPAEVAEEDDFSPFARRDGHEPKERRPLRTILLILLLIAALAAAFWFLAPAEWKARVGLSAAQETPLQLMMTHSDRQQLASGNELLAVSGRVINPTNESQAVPPITAELRSNTGELVYSWTIAPPARTLGPGDSATFNSAEMNVPAGGEELTVSLGAPRA